MRLMHFYRSCTLVSRFAVCSAPNTVTVAILALCPALIPTQSTQEPVKTAPQVMASPSATPEFDVAAIHLHIPEPHEHNSIWSSPLDGHFKAVNESVVMLIHWAYEMPETRILGAPGWTSSTFFNIEAEADPALDQQMHNLGSDAGRKMKELMVQAMLADRFKLVTHMETREMPIYALVVTKGGPKLGDPKSDGTNVSHSRDHLEVEGADSLTLLAEELSKEVGRDVVDKTGVSGRYDLKLKWAPDDASASASGNGASADAGPSLFTALQEQLGLRLEAAKGPVQVLVIDHVEEPSTN